jgi:hypothetical protein
MGWQGKNCEFVLYWQYQRLPIRRHRRGTGRIILF